VTSTIFLFINELLTSSKNDYSNCYVREDIQLLTDKYSIYAYPI